MEKSRHTLIQNNHITNSQIINGGFAYFHEFKLMFVGQLHSNTGYVILSERQRVEESTHYDDVCAAIGAKILRLRRISYGSTQDDKFGRLCDKLKFNCCRSDTERVWAVTIRSVPGTYWQRRLAAKL